MKSELTTAYSIRIGQYARGTAASGGKADIAAVAGAGFTTLINNRPDGEAQVQPLDNAGFDFAPALNL